MSPEVGTAARLPASARACDALVLVYAGWTLVCHAVVLLGGSLDTLLAATAVLALTTVLGLALARRKRGPSPATPAPVAGPHPGSDAGAGGRPALLALAGGAGVVALHLATGSVVATWWAAVLVLGAAAVGLARVDRSDDEGAQPAPAAGAWRERALWGLALAGALATQLVQRPDIDDAYYVNVATALAADPRAPLLRYDTLYGIEGLPLMLSVYRLHSFELLGAAIARVTSLEAIEACHLVVPALFGLFVPLALARLFRRLLPRDWLLAVLVLCLLLATSAETHRWYGNFAFVRMHHGKGVFLTILVPLLVVHAFDFARAPAPRRWLLLAAAQVAALGMTATALWAAPAVAGLALLGSVPASRRGLARLALGGLASGYLVVLALAFRGATSAVVSGLRLPDHAAPERGDGAGLVRSAWELSNGTGPLALACLFALVAGWGACRTAPARRLVAVLSLAFLLLLLDPYLAQLVADAVTSGMTYFRVFWVLPLPVLLTLCLLWPLQVPRAPRALLVALTAAGAGAFLWLVPRVHALDPENFAHLDPFGLKVHPDEYRAARLLAASVPPGSHVAASQFVAVYVGTFPDHPWLITSRLDYLEFLPRWLDDVDLEKRRFLGFVLLSPGSLQRPDWRARFERLLEEYEVRGVAFLLADHDLPHVLRAHGFAPVGRTERYAVWTRA